SLRIHIEQRIAAMMGNRGGRGIKDDEERLENELYKLESSYGVLVSPCDVAAKKEEKGVMWLILRPRME
ncbi:hypothetical protein Tco_0600238, partial [Tanacetum coccineum]